MYQPNNINTYYILYLDDKKGIYLHWRNDYNDCYVEHEPQEYRFGQNRKDIVDDYIRSSKTPIVMGIDVKINIAKRQKYCQENGMIIENYIFQEPKWKQTAALPLNAEFNLHYPEVSNIMKPHDFPYIIDEICPSVEIQYPPAAVYHPPNSPIIFQPSPRFRRYPRRKHGVVYMI